MNKRPQEAMTRIGNLVFNKHGSKKDEEAWMKIKKYIEALEIKSPWRIKK